MDVRALELRGGAVVNLEEMREAIASLEEKADADVTERPLVCLLSTSRFFSRTLYLIQHLIHSYRFVILEGRRASLDDLTRLDPDLCWVCYPYKDGQLALAAQRVLNIPYVLTARGEYWHIDNDELRVRANDVVLGAAQVITLSDTFVRQLIRYLPAASGQSFVRVPNGITTLGNLDGAAADLEVLVNLSRPFVTTVTNFMFEEKQRAVQELVAVFEEAAWEGTFLIASKEGPFSLPLGRIGNRSHHLGFMPNIRRFLNESSVFVYHSYFDSQPSALMEALAEGLPCVVIKDSGSGAHEFLVGGKTGLVCASVQECVATVLHLLEDRAEADRLGKAAHHAARTDYTWEEAARGHAAVFQEVCAQRTELPQRTKETQGRPWEVWSEERTKFYVDNYGSPQDPRRDHKTRMLLAAGLLCGKTVLDVGCGVGHLYPYLSVEEYLGIDNSDAMLRRARAFFPEADFALGDVYDLTEFGMYDTVYCQSVLVHLPNIAGPLNHLWAHARRALVFSVTVADAPALIKEPHVNDRYLIRRKDTRQSLLGTIGMLSGASLQEEIELEYGNVYMRLMRRRA